MKIFIITSLLQLLLVVAGHPKVSEVNSSTIPDAEYIEATTEVEILSTTPFSTLPEGYVKFDEDHAAYKVHKTSSTWNEARDTCKSEGGHLPITQSHDKIERLVFLDKGDVALIPIGIYKSNETGQWVRVDNDLPVKSMPWRYDERTSSENCVVLDVTNSELKNSKCDLANGFFVCEIPINQDESEKESTEVAGIQNATSSITLPEGYVSFEADHAAYKVHESSGSWLEADKICKAEDANLIVVDSPEKSKRLNDLLYGLEFQFRPVGIRKSNETDEWFRVDNGLAISWTALNSDDDDDDDGDCAFLGVSGLYAYYCGHYFNYFVCEIRMQEK